MTRKVHLAVMAYDGNLPVPSLSMIVGSLSEMGAKHNCIVQYSFRFGDSILPRSRNAELANFLHDPDATDMIMIDADTYCSPPDLTKLLLADVDVVGAPYRTRNEPLVWASVRWMHQDVKLASNGLLEVEALGTGLFRMTRRAAQMLYDAEPRSYKDPTCKPGTAKPVFWFDVVDGHLWGEDIVICKKWRALGGKVWTDPSISTAHMGHMSYNGNLAEWLSQQPENMLIDDVIGVQTKVKNHFSTQRSIPVQASEAA